ncbi:unnamed protein product, partial [Polarella glacialis]
ETLKLRGLLVEDLGGHHSSTASEEDSETCLGVLRLLPQTGSDAQAWLNRRVDIILCRREHLPIVLLLWTGSGLFLRELHKLANLRGLHIGRTTLSTCVPGCPSTQVIVSSEEEVFAALGLQYRPPSARELDADFVRELQAARAQAAEGRLKAATLENHADPPRELLTTSAAAILPPVEVDDSD